MNKLAFVVAGLAFFSTAALADSKPADDEAGKIKAALTDWGCTGGTFEKETEASSCLRSRRREVQGRQPVRRQARQQPQGALDHARLTLRVASLEFVRRPICLGRR